MAAKKRTQNGGRGRPCKLTPAVQRRIVRLVEEHGYLSSVPGKGTPGRTTIYRWMQRGEREPGSIYAAFRDAIHDAERRCEDRLVGVVMKAAMNDGKFALKVLQAKWPERYAERTKLTLQEEREGILDALREGLDEETYARIVGVLARRTDGGSRAPSP